MCVLVCQVTKVEEFFSLSHCQLLELISQDSLKVLCESEVCCFTVERWRLCSICTITV